MMGQAGTFPGEKVKRQADIFSGERGIAVRQSAADQPEKNERHIALVLMASGYGRRYGSNKLLEEFRGRPLFVHALEQAAGSGADSICVVTRYPEIRDYVDRWKKAGRRDSMDGETLSEDRQFSRPVRTSVSSPVIRNTCVVWNSHPERGISESLRLGLSARPEADGCCFMVCDQPLLTSGTLRRMMKAFCRDPDAIFVCSDGCRRGNPVLFPKELFGELMQLTGDSGGRQILRKYPGRIREIIAARPEELCDVDSAKDLEFLKKSL